MDKNKRDKIVLFFFHQLFVWSPYFKFFSNFVLLTKNLSIVWNCSKRKKTLQKVQWLLQRLPFFWLFILKKKEGLRSPPPPFFFTAAVGCRSFGWGFFLPTGSLPLGCRVPRRGFFSSYRESVGPVGGL